MNRALFFLLLSAVASGQQYVMSTFAGGVPPVTPVDASAVSIGDPPRVAVDSAGNAYFGSLHSLFKVDRRGSLVRIAGTGRAGLTGDGGPGMAAQLNYPVGIAVDSAGAVFYTERDVNLIRKVAADGSISTLPIDSLSSPMGLAFDPSGNLFVAEMGANAIRKIAPNGTITTFAGNGVPGFTGDGGPATCSFPQRTRRHGYRSRRQRLHRRHVQSPRAHGRNRREHLDRRRERLSSIFRRQRAGDLREHVSADRCRPRQRGQPLYRGPRKQPHPQSHATASFRRLPGTPAVCRLAMA